MNHPRRDPHSAPSSNTKGPFTGWLGWLVAICASVLLLEATLLFGAWTRTSQPFESELWKAGGPTQVEDPYYTARDLMVDDLLDRELLIGLSRHEVLDLLGEPGLRSEGLADDETWEYWISSGLVDPIYLAVTFGLNGIVTKAWTFET